MVSSAQTSNKDTVPSYPHVLPQGDEIVSSFVLESEGRDSCPFSAIFIQRMPNEHVLNRS